MQSNRELFLRVVINALILSALDALSGRFFQASPDPSLVLFLGATAWVSYRMVELKRDALAIPLGVTMAGVYAAGFLLSAALLVGWNRSVPWHPRSWIWVMGVLAAVPLVALVAKRRALRQRTADHAP